MWLLTVWWAERLTLITRQLASKWAENCQSLQARASLLPCPLHVSHHRTSQTQEDAAWTPPRSGRSAKAGMATSHLPQSLRHNVE